MRPYTLAGLVLIIGVAAALPFRRPRPAVPELDAVTAAVPEQHAGGGLEVEPPPPPRAAESLAQPLPLPDARLPELDGGYGEVAIPLAEPRTAVDPRLLVSDEPPPSLRKPAEPRFRTGVPLLEFTAETLPPVAADAPPGVRARAASSSAEAAPHRTALRSAVSSDTAPASEKHTAGERTATGTKPTSEAELPAPRPRYFIREPAR